MAWTSTDEKNEFIRSTNYLKENFNSALLPLNEITNYHTNLENIASIYQNKILDLNEILENQNANFFSKNFSFSSSIINYFLSILEEALTILQKIQKRLQILHPLYLNNITAKMNDAALHSLVKRYQQLCSYIKDFQLDKNLEQALLSEYTRTEYWIYTPGSFYKKWELDQYWLTRLQLENVKKQIEPKLLPIITKQEKASVKFQMKYQSGTIEQTEQLEEEEKSKK